MAWEYELSGTVLEDLYLWINHILLLKSKRKLERDFSDGKLLNIFLLNKILNNLGVLAAEVIQYYLPDMVSMTDYSPNSAIGQKKINWGTLNRKVLSQLGLNLPDNVIKDLSYAKPGTIQTFLFNLRFKIDEIIESRQKNQTQDVASSSRESSVSLNNASSTNDDKPVVSKRTSRSIGNLRDKWVSRFDYEDLKQQSLQLQEEIEILQARLRRLEHVIRLKEFRIAELSSTIEDYRHLKPAPITNTTTNLSTNKNNKKK